MILKAGLFLVAGTCALALCGQSDGTEAKEVIQELAPGEDPSSGMSPKPADLRAVAERGLHRQIEEFQREIEPGTLPQDFPINVPDLESLQDVHLGMGYQLHTVHPRRLLESADLENIVTPLDQWHFVLMLKERPVGILEIARQGRAWEMVSIGCAALAQDVCSMANQYAGKGQFRFVRIFQATSDLMEIRSERDGEARYVPLLAARETLHLGRPTAYDQIPRGRDLMSQLCEATAQNLSLVHE